jgi:predicted HTH domain antitoxin
VLKEQTVLRLFEQGKIASGYAAQLLDISRREFLDLLARRGVPILSFTKAELKKEFEAADALVRQVRAREKHR